MKKRFFSSLLLCLGLLVSPNLGIQSIAKTTNAVDALSWVDTNFGKGKIPPFSFSYGGKSSDTFIKSWGYKSEHISDNATVKKRRVIYTDKKTQLQVVCEITAYTDFQAVEWTVFFTNTSQTNNSLIIKDAQALDYGLSIKSKNTVNIHHAQGSWAGKQDFHPELTQMNKGDSVYFTALRGRSSNESAFPFFNIETPDKKGVMVAIGWSGNWHANLRRDNSQGLALTAGMKYLETYLLPDETIRTPKVALLFWEGEDRMIGHNKFRRFILAHHTRLINGKVPEMPLAVIIDREAPQPFTENEASSAVNSIAHIMRHKQFDMVPDAFWMDAGWYGNGSWWSNVGNWVPNETRFPNGIRPVSDAAREVGADFLLWFEPERCYQNVVIPERTAHPEWFTALPNNPNLLVNLGNKDALKWVTQNISEFIEREGLDYYRQDFNMDPQPYWEQLDTEGRVGIAEIGHITGLYAFWDALLTRFPNLIIDNCASGGRRIDLETTSRSTPFWRTDYHYGEPIGSQNHTYGLNFFLPLSGTGTYVLNPYNSRSAMSSSLLIGWNINSQGHKVADMQQMMKEARQLKPYYHSADYYPLTPSSDVLKDDSWLAYQMNRPEEKDGIVMAFRRPGNASASISVKLKGLKADIQYEVINQDTGEKMKLTGGELQQGFELILKEAPGSLLLHYNEL